MADYVASFAYQLTPDGLGGLTIGPQVLSPGFAGLTDNNPASTTFESTGFLSPIGSIGISSYTGNFNNGVIVNFLLPPPGFLLGMPYYVSSTEATFGTPVAVNAAPFTVCFLAGTMIAVPGGERAVEDLAIGDSVMTADGAMRAVKWIGRQTVMPLFADAQRSHPVRIMAGALGEDLPVRDLCLSPDHALLIDGLLVHAGALVNGTTIARMTGLPERFVYYHVEVEDHALILADGVPAETFVDNVSRRRFDNWPEYEALYGAEAPTGELRLPRVKSSRQLPGAIHVRLDARSRVLLGDVAQSA